MGKKSMCRTGGREENKSFCSYTHKKSLLIQKPVVLGDGDGSRSGVEGREQAGRLGVSRRRKTFDYKHWYL